MNKLSYIVKSKTPYSVQSPMVYDLCSKVLWTTLSKQQRTALQLGSRDVFAALCYRVANHLQPRSMVLMQEDQQAVRVIGLGCASTRIEQISRISEGTIVMVNHPHDNEEAWNQLKAMVSRTAVVDIFSAGIVFIGWGLSREVFLLRR